jgi:CRP/FNR family cyclic AMP-dependent transcriptional regulator
MAESARNGLGALDGWPISGAGRISLLDADPDLGREIPAERWDAAVEALTGPAIRVGRGPLPPLGERPGDGVLFGYLVIGGLILREVTVTGRPSVELLGPGDLVRPWLRDSVELLPRTVSWSVAEQATLAPLGGPFAARLAAWPEVVEVLLDRAIGRAQTMALQRSIASHVRVDVRLLAFLWHLAERWGIVTPDAVRIEVPLTHATLSRMVGARRPTVTTALQRLMHLGYIRREAGKFIVIGDASSVAKLESRSPSNGMAMPEPA